MIEPSLPFTIESRRSVLALHFPVAQRMLSWAVTHPGFTETADVAWLEVSDADLPIGRDPVGFLDMRLSEEGLGDAIGLMTACDLRRHRVGRETVEGVTATVVTTAGLRNGEFIGRRLHRAASFEPPPHGTIITFVHVSAPLSDAALIETISVATEARTVATLETTLRRGGDIVTGTGSDCIVVAAPRGGSVPYAGLHTAVGEAVGAAVLQATCGAVSCWLRDEARGRVAVPAMPIDSRARRLRAIAGGKTTH